MDLLNSIKYQVLTFAPSFPIQIVFLDDKSNDSTVQLFSDWLIKASQIASIKGRIIINDTNLGIKRNYLKACGLVNTKFYKILGGDDLFSYNNLFSYLDYCSEKMLVFSPVFYKFTTFYFDYSFLKILRLERKDKFLLRKLSKRNLFNAPGAHISYEIIKSKDYINSILDFDGNNEDYPSWLFILGTLRLSYITYKDEVIIYRPHFGRLFSVRLPITKSIKIMLSTIYYKLFFLSELKQMKWSKSKLSKLNVYYDGLKTKE